MKKFYLSYEQDGMHIFDYDTENGVRFFRNSVIIYNNTKIISALYDSLAECLESLRSYSSSVIYHGENINSLQPDLFVTYNTATGETWRGYHFDDSILKKYEDQKK